MRGVTASKESFEEWFHPISLHIKPYNNKTKDHVDRIGGYCEQAWNHQQTKIEKLEAENKKLREYYGKIVNVKDMFELSDELRAIKQYLKQLDEEGSRWKI